MRLRCLSRLAAGWVGVVAAGTFLHAQGLKPREKAADYPVHAELGDGFTLAAEYLVHTLPTGKDTLVANDYLVVEAAVFGPRGKRIDLSQGSFTLVLDTGKKGGKTTLTQDSAGTVAGSIKFSDWTPKPRVEGTGGVGNATVGVGPTMTPRFPGDPSVRPLPPSPLPEQNPAGIEKEQPLSIDERVQRAALPSGELTPPAGGLIFFPFEGKTKSIKTLELVYDGPAARVTLRLE
jgi:hypothetical protein